MKFKFISILIIFLMVFSTMGCVSATTITNHKNTNTSNKVIVVNDPTVSNIRNAINTAQTGDTILINGSSTDTGDITIDKDALTIKGQNCTLNKVTWTVNKDTSFENITFKNNDESTGSAIFSSANINVKNSSFINNHAISKLGSVIHTDGSVTVSDCVFENNSAEFYGGAIYSTESVSIFNSTFNNNCAKTEGGAVWSNKEVNVTNSLFTNNNCNGAIIMQCEGGAIHSNDGSVIAKNSTFIRNYADDYGGAIYADDSVTVSDCDFENNTAAENEGGAIYADDESVSISNSTFNNNNAKTEGGAVWSNKEVNVINSLFTNNNCNGAIIMQCEGGAIHSNDGSVIAKNSIFIRNYADDYGGAIYADDSVTVSDCDFENNTAADDEGGAIYADDESVSISNSTFNNNNAKIEGGAVWSNKGTTVNNSLFTNNNCSNPEKRDPEYWHCEGGAIYSDSGGVTIENSSFIKNSADDYGGAVWSDDNINVDNSLFKNNIAKIKYGGALYADDDPVILFNSTFIGNRAGDNGGVFYDNGIGDHDVVRSCNIHDNYADLYGGAIYMDSHFSHIDLTGNAIYNNNAGTGEGLDVYTYGYFNTVNGNWWGTNNPDWRKHLLYEHRTFLPDRDHSDSNPLNYNPFNNTTIVDSK